MVRPFYDAIPTVLVFLGTAFSLILAGELGFRAGSRARPRTDEADGTKGQAGILLGALLALLGLLLAFSFNLVEGRFHQRKQLVLAEANAIGTAWLRAGLLPARHAERARAQLYDYVQPRAALRSKEQLPEALARAEALHQAMWDEAEAVARVDRSPVTALYIAALNDVVDLHGERVSVSLYHRLPPPILLTLYLVAALGVVMLGYTGGLSRARAPLPALAFIVAVSVVSTLIIDLDRPWQRVFRVGQEALIDVVQTIEREVVVAPAGASP